ncbi:MAG: hypothetical protein K0R28_3370 [Paenibacillus sp.]|jgi:hypothetical protein|nr:hypothetical protein [Paenibacillus sp.]
MSSAASMGQETNPRLLSGWAQGDLTPPESVLLLGQFHARMSEGVMDPLTVTAWALQSGEEQSVLVSCDFCTISHDLLHRVRNSLRGLTSEIDPMKVVLNATHSHTAPENVIPHLRVDTESAPGKDGVIRVASREANVPLVQRTIGDSMVQSGPGVDLPVWSVERYITFAAERIAETIVQAWRSRVPGGIAFGLSYAVLGRNRRWVSNSGETFKRFADERFSHFEGYEDHSVHVLAVYDADERLTGLVVNVPFPSQVSESQFLMTADIWYETRIELRRRFGEHVYILPQCSASGELCPGPYYERPANSRMLELKGNTFRQEVAERISEAVADVLPYIGGTIETNPIMRKEVLQVALSATPISEAEALAAREQAIQALQGYRKEMNKLRELPELKEKPRWYQAATSEFRRMNWYLNVVHRYEQQVASYDVELHVLRLGQVAFATNPFECYLDYGIQMKIKSPAVQTFVVQLAGGGTYLPSPRAYEGGAYGAVPESCPVGPQGASEMVAHTVTALQAMWAEPAKCNCT